MSQHDYNLANASGAAFRADANDVLGAVVTWNSGATAPSTTFARQRWADTTAGVIKRRNAANSAWIVVSTDDESFVLSRSSNTILDISDIGKVIRATSGFTQTLDAAATLGDGWFIGYRVESGVAITFDPTSSEQIDGAATKIVVGPKSGFIYCNGSAFYTLGLADNATLLAKSGAAVSAPADTAENTLATITVPAGALGANGFIRYRAHFLVTNNANVKTLRIKFGGTTIAQFALGGITSCEVNGTICNANATNAQAANASNLHDNFTGNTQFNATAAIDTTAATTATITAQKATAGDTFTLIDHLFEIVADGT